MLWLHCLTNPRYTRILGVARDGATVSRGFPALGARPISSDDKYDERVQIREVIQVARNTQL